MELWYVKIRCHKYIYTQALNIEMIPLEFRQNYLTNTLAFALYPVYWSDNSYYEKKNRNENVHESIFRAISSEEHEKLLFSDLQEFDIKLLTEVYSASFNEKIEVARKQFKPFIIIMKWIQINPMYFYYFR